MLFSFFPAPTRQKFYKSGFYEYFPKDHMFISIQDAVVFCRPHRARCHFCPAALSLSSLTVLPFRRQSVVIREPRIDEVAEPIEPQSPAQFDHRAFYNDLQTDGAMFYRELLAAARSADVESAVDKY